MLSFKNLKRKERKNMKSKISSKILSGLISCTMIFSMLTVSGFVSNVNAENDDLVMNKSAQLEDDGTYTIKLEAYAKGDVITTTTKKVVPTDIVLVLDQSGSMQDDKYLINGVPTNTYTLASGVTNSSASNSKYYYKVNDSYYPVKVEKVTSGIKTVYKGDDGKEYKPNELSDHWQRKYDSQIYYTSKPFVTNSLSTWTRSHNTSIGITSFWYVNDVTNEQSSKRLSASSARNAFQSTYGTNGYTVEFHNDGSPSAGDTSADDPYYVAAVYVAVTESTEETYQYSYSYIDDNGNSVSIGKTDGTEDGVCPYELYTRDTIDGAYRIDALKYAANQFINDIHGNALKNNVDHRVAIVGFGSSNYGNKDNEYYYANSELFIGATQYNYALNGKESTYNSSGNLASNHYGDAFQSVKDSQGYQNAINSINNLSAKGATRPELGFDMANGIFEAYSSEERNRVVIFLTDGEPGNSGYDSTVATETLNKINITKNTYNAKIYTVAVLNTNPTGDVDQFLKDSSSSGQYTLATNTSSLENFFQTVDEEISNTETSVTLTGNAKLIDYLSDDFILPDGFTVENNVKLEVAKHTGDESFTAPIAAPNTIKAEVSGNSIVVTGFDFASQENVVTTTVDGGSTIAKGNKLIVTIEGILAKDSAAKNHYISTNTNLSGIYDKDSEGDEALVKAFNLPNTFLANKYYVLDYANTTEIPALNSSNNIDSSEDGIFSAVGDDSNSLSCEYGNVNVSNGKLNYTPKTMNWDGYDTFYALGKDDVNGDKTTQNEWAKVNVIPANNVYYDDTFITDESTGTVGIEYTGNWTTIGRAMNTTTPVGNDGSNSVHGWEETYGDDAEDSNGSVHYSSDSTAKASFSFTGTGVDIYSRTDMKTGTVLVQLKSEEVDENNNPYTNKVLIVDNKGSNETYYQIPTVSFNHLDYGKYNVTLYVTNQAASEKRLTYYLDGIRVYNPLSDEKEQDNTVQDAYGQEKGALFTPVRNILLDAESFGNEGIAQGAVFIVENKDGNGETTSNISTYKKLGPKSEVYLDNGQLIAFKIEDLNAKYYVGLKAPQGATTAEITNGNEKSTLNINAASDMYYELTPNSDGYIIIKNTGDKLLSITKLKVTNQDSATETSYLSTVSEDEIIAYNNEFSTLSLRDYKPVEDNTEDDSGDVDITNPDDEQDNNHSQIKEWFKNLFDKIREWFGK